MPLISRLKKLRKRQEASVEDFLETPAIVYLSGRFPQTHQATVNYWNDWIPYAPQEIAKIFAEEFDEGFELFITPQTHGEFAFVLEQEGVGKRKQTYNFQYGFTTDSWTAFDEGARGGKVGRKIAMRFMELDVAFGVKKMRQDAGKLLGAYVWAAMGFNISRDSERDIRSASLNSQIVLARLESIRDMLPKSEFLRAQQLAQGTHIDDMYHLAHQNFDLSGISIDWEDVQRTMARSLLILSNNLDEDEAKKLALDEVKKMQPVFSFTKATGIPTKVGKLALVGRNWPSVVDYRNNVQMQRIQTYGGDFKTAELK